MAPRLHHLPCRLVGALVIGLGLVGPLAPSARAANDTPGSKGAQVYCFMRANNNPHEVSWVAAYALIKRQSASMFKTSPEHAAVMITEAVVQNPGSFPDCGRFLGDLYNRRVQEASSAAAAAAAQPTGTTSTTPGGGTTRGDRYGN